MSGAWPSGDGCWDRPRPALGTKNSSLQDGRGFPAWLTWKTSWCPERPQTPSWRSSTWPSQEEKFLVPTGLVQLLWVLQVAFCTTLNAFLYLFPSFTMMSCDLCHPFSLPLPSGLYLDGVVLSLYKSFLQSHRAAEINLKEIGPAVFAIQWQKFQLKLCIKRTIWNEAFGFHLPLYHS